MGVVGAGILGKRSISRLTRAIDAFKTAKDSKKAEGIKVAIGFGDEQSKGM